MNVSPEIDTSQLEAIAKNLKNIDREVRKEFVKDLKGNLLPYAKNIVNDIPTANDPPLSGFRHFGRTAWNGVNASVHVTPGSGLKGSIARIEVYGRGRGRAAFKMIDLAGTENDWETYSGLAMITELQKRYPLSEGGRAGRFAWRGFMQHRPKFMAIIERRTEYYAGNVAKRLIMAVQGEGKFKPASKGKKG